MRRKFPRRISYACRPVTPSSAFNGTSDVCISQTLISTPIATAGRHASSKVRVDTPARRSDLGSVITDIHWSFG